MEAVMSFAAAHWDYAAVGVGSMWLGDWAGRKFPRAWSWLRLGLKNAGDAVKDAVKE